MFASELMSYVLRMVYTPGPSKLCKGENKVPQILRSRTHCALGKQILPFKL